MALKHFKKIIICVHPEFTDLEIVDRAARMAKNTGAAVKVKHVIGDYPEDMKEWWNVRDPQRLHSKIVEERQRFVDGIVERVKEIGVTQVDSELGWGQESVELIRDVIKNGHELAVITSRHKGKIAKMLFECPSMDLLRYCPCSLLVTHAHHKITRHYRRVVAALNSESGVVKCEGLNAKVLQTAASVADAEGSELHVVHALPVYGGHGLEEGNLHADLVEHLETMRHDIKNNLNTTILESTGLELTDERIHLLAGAPLTVIPDFLHEQGIDLLVMGTLARTGIPGLIVGNIAEKMLDLVECAALVVKPDEFVSMITLEEEAVNN